MRCLAWACLCLQVTDNRLKTTNELPYNEEQLGHTEKAMYLITQSQFLKAFIIV
jgi:hypothetical protein